MINFETILEAVKKDLEPIIAIEEGRLLLYIGNMQYEVPSEMSQGVASDEAYLAEIAQMYIIALTKLLTKEFLKIPSLMKNQDLIN